MNKEIDLSFLTQIVQEEGTISDYRFVDICEEMGVDLELAYAYMLAKDTTNRIKGLTGLKKRLVYDGENVTGFFFEYTSHEFSWNESYFRNRWYYRWVRIKEILQSSKNFPTKSQK